MAKRTGGFIGQDGINAPDQATGVEASAGDTQVDVSFTSPSDVGGAAITGYRVQSNDGIGASGSASPITVTGLTNGTSYTFNVWAINPFGWSSPSDASEGVSPSAPIGLFAGGRTTGSGSSATNVIDFITLSSAGNTSDFGDLTVTRFELFKGSAGSSTRGLFIGGENASGTTQDVVDYITFTSAGNATDFGNLSTARHLGGSSSNGTRALAAGGNDSLVIDYFTIASTGNATNFGNLTAASKTVNVSSLASNTRAVFGSDSDGSSNVMSYVTIASTGNAADFGDLLSSVQKIGAGSDTTRGIWTGGIPSNVIQYITIASTGNATDFGDLTASSEDNTAVTDTTKMAISLAYSGSAIINTIDQITIQTTGNASDFGDLSTARQSTGGASSAHGGLS